MLDVAVIGAAGRMGSETCRAVEGAEDMRLVARVASADEMTSLADAGAKIAVEFTTPASVEANVRTCIAHGIHCVVGATGLGPEALESLDSEARTAGVGVFVAPNFALGAVLMMHLARVVAPHYEWAEVVERHHERKLDAPSGTARRTAELIRDARGSALASPADETETVTGARGGDVEGVRVHSLRLPGSVAHQEVMFGAPGETLTIRHDSLDRTSFMPGVLLAIRHVGDEPGVRVGLERLLDL